VKKITVTQNNDGSIDVDGNPAESIEDALEQIKAQVDPNADMEAPEAELNPEDTGSEGEDMPIEEDMPSENVSKSLGAKMPMIDKKKMGMRPKQKASFEDYGI
jgi:hypothetical protein